MSTKSKIRVKNPSDDVGLSTTHLICIVSGGTLGCVGKLVLVTCQEHFCVQRELCSDKAAAHSSSSCEAVSSDASSDGVDTSLTLTRVRGFFRPLAL